MGLYANWINTPATNRVLQVRVLLGPSIGKTIKIFLGGFSVVFLPMNTCRIDIIICYSMGMRKSVKNFV